MQRFAISGASGWLGREFINYLLVNNIVENLSDFKLYSSQGKTLDFGNFGKIESENFLDADVTEMVGVDNFIHLAFLTRGLESKYGRELFSRINADLTSKADEFIRRAKPRNVVNVSSGAVFNRKTGFLEHDPTGNLYGFGKLQEEKRLFEAAKHSGSNLAIGRLWGCTGEFMPINRAYALSDLIYTSIMEKRITIKAKGLVWRRYCDAGQFMYLLHLISQKESFSLINSGGPKIEIGELAELISDSLGGVSINRVLDSNTLEDDYYPRDSDFERSAIEYGLSLLTILDQVRNTILGHQRALSALE